MKRLTPGSGSEYCCKNNVRYENTCYINVKCFLKMSMFASVSDRIHLFQLPQESDHEYFIVTSSSTA